MEFVKAVVSQREIKSSEELVEINKAVNTSVDMHVAAMQMVRPGITEQEITNKVHEIAMRDGGRLSFPTIATIHGETLHNHYHGNTLKEGDLFLIDCGAETPMGYAGDLSSTMPVSGKLDARQKEIYDLTLVMHQGAIDMLKPGVPFIEVYYQACRIMVNGLNDLGLMKGNTEDALVAGAHAMFFQCGLGHQMGLDVHDMEDLGEVYVGYDGQSKSTQFGIKSLRLGKALKPGMVITIEPGIYFIPALMDLWGKEQKFKDFINYDKLNTYHDFGGIRNEEDFVITEDGYQLLGKPKPKTIEDVISKRKF
jgi:Xaa-Pro aminopeptidase